MQSDIAEAQRGPNLEFEDIRDICNLLLASDDSSLISEISQIVNKDIELKNTKYSIDCRMELKGNRELVPQEFSISMSRPTNAIAVLKDFIRAILLFEYRRLFKNDGSEFRKGKLTTTNTLRGIKSIQISYSISGNDYL